jgi:transposase-like protein
MEKYNKHDILSTEELYLKLRAWKPEFNFNAFTSTTENKCICGSTDFREGVKYTNNAAHARFNCNECGAEYVDKSRNLLSGLKKASLKELSI